MAGLLSVAASSAKLRFVGRVKSIAVSMAVGLSLLGARPTHAAAPKTRDAEALIDEAEIAADEGRHTDAAEAYAAAYRGLSLSMRAGPIGAQVIGKAVRAYKAVAASDGAAALAGCVDLLEMHVGDLRTQGKTDQLVELEEMLTRIREQVEDSQSPVEEPVEPVETLEATPAEEEKEATVIVTPGATGRDDRALGRPQTVGLLVGGSVLTLGGVAMIAGGVSGDRTAQQRLDDRGGEMDGDTKYLADARTT
ncbi:MAG: hypothetical protein JKY37_00615, partial [Nannocystaceae bacterium]|nr:hypothetical protein [Nannocystaceae bacterium]